MPRPPSGSIPSTFIFARTDARAVHGLDDALRRAERYLRAGADGLFIEAPESVEELARIGRAFDVPLVANPLEGGKTPLLTPAEFAELGFTVIPYGITLILHAANAMKAAIDDVMSGAFARRDAAMSFADYLKVVGEPGWARLQDKYGGAEAVPRTLQRWTISAASAQPGCQDGTPLISTYIGSIPVSGERSGLQPNTTRSECRAIKNVPSATP